MNIFMKCILLLISALFFNSCFSTDFFYKNNVFTKVYGIIEDGQINRMNISKNDLEKAGRIIAKKFGIIFENDPDGRYTIYPTLRNEDYRKVSFSIKFYNDFKYTVNGKEYIIPKENIYLDKKDFKYVYYVPIDIRNTTDDIFILDIGEIEIHDLMGLVEVKKVKIPPLIFKKAYNKYLSMYLYEKEYYYGWYEDFSKIENK